MQMETGTQLVESETPWDTVLLLPKLAMGEERRLEPSATG